MSLGNRTGNRHLTRTSSRHEAVRPADYADYSVGQRVLTREGFIGKVTSVEDGPFPGTENYRITLEGGMGGGVYGSSDIIGTAGNTTASVESTAAQDYPELGSILADRPDIAREGARRDPFVVEARQSQDLGPDWVHHPGNQEFGEPEHYEHNDMEREYTKRIVPIDGGMRKRWGIQANHWCGYQHQMAVPQKDYGDKGFAHSALDARDSNRMSHVDKQLRDHAQTYHNADNSCRYDPSLDDRSNLRENSQASNYHSDRGRYMIRPDSAEHPPKWTGFEVSPRWQEGMGGR